MTWNATDIISLAAVVGAAVALINYTNRAFIWLHKTTQQADDLKTVKEEQRIMSIALSACLDGLVQLGANHEVPKAKKELDDYIYSIQSDVNKAQAALKEAEAAEKALDAELEKMLRELQQRENSQYVGGTFNWPTPVSYKRISSKFGWRKLNGEDNYHGGIDIPCPTGTNITASNGGTVIKSEWHYSYGYYVLINHGGGMSTLYAHNSKLLVSVGDVVTQGQVIALAGNTGNSYGSHCHFEVRVDGTRKNPMDYVTPPQGWYYS